MDTGVDQHFPFAQEYLNNNAKPQEINVNDPKNNLSDGLLLTEPTNNANFDLDTVQLSQNPSEKILVTLPPKKKGTFLNGN